MPENLDKPLIEEVLRFTKDNNIHLNSEEIVEYINRDSLSLNLSIKNKGNYLVTQPTFLLLGFLMQSHSENIKTDLKLPYTTKKEIFKTLGVAYN
jgi:phage regulator Rha-like protein